MTVKGHYNLVSVDSAKLALYITSTNEATTPDGPNQSRQISKGQGDFELTNPHVIPGLPHVNMYAADGKPFAELYFGTKDEAAEESRLNLGNKQAAATNYPGDWIWEFNSETLKRVPPIFLLRPTAFPTNYVPGDMFGQDSYLTRRQTLKDLIARVWSQKNSSLKIFFEADLPGDRFDFIVTHQPQWPEKLQAEIDRRFHLQEEIEMRGGADVVVVRDLSLALQPPVVVETSPVSGAQDVEPGVVDIRVRFSKPMTDNSWSWLTAWENSAPEFIGTPHYEADMQTCVAKVKLEPGRTYGFWLNSDQFLNFKDSENRPAIPYPLIFQTKQK